MLAGGAPCGGPLKAVCSTQQTRHPDLVRTLTDLWGKLPAAACSGLQAALC